MQYHSVAEIMSALDETRERLYRRAESLDAARENFRAAPDGWSTAEVFEHLSIIEGQMVQLLGMLLKKAEASGGARAEGAPFAPVSIDELAKQVSGVKLQAPEEVRLKGGVSLAESLARLRQSREALRRIAARLERVDASGARYPHPFLGPLNAYQWLLFIAGHEERHLGQVEKLIQAAQTQG